MRARFALLAQLVEHLIRNEGVICSNQIEGTMNDEGHPQGGLLFFENLQRNACSR
jgi:hypothetical protein